MDAVNDARFVRTFGIIGLLGSILIFVGVVAIGIGFAVAGFDKGRYNRVLGSVVAILALCGYIFAPLRIVSSIVLCTGVAWKGKETLNVLANEGKEYPDWEETRKGTVIGIVLSVIGIIIGFAWLALILVVATGRGI